MGSELKACPFCGSTPQIVTRNVEPQGDPWYGRKDETFVLCDCGACLFDGAFHEGFYDAETRAVEAWNRRSPSPAPVGEPVNLWPVIQWLEAGCDPKHAATELRMYAERTPASPLPQEVKAMTDAGASIKASHLINDLEYAVLARARDLPGSSEKLSEAKQAIRSALERELRGPQEGKEGEWMPIETAPKDGTQIILSNGISVAQGWWEHQEPYIHEERDMEGNYIDQDEFDGFDGWLDCEGGMLPEPTHWMPLPAPPSAPLLGDQP